MAEQTKSKIISFDGAVKTKSIDGERRIVFVASSNKADRDYEQVHVASLRLPLKGGGEIVAEAIPSEGVNDLIDVPLMLNHSGDVRDVIGSVRSAYYEAGELVFEAGISNRDVAQDMLTLLEEGHLSNAFSISMIDYDYNATTGMISNAEVVEVSLVHRGSNKDARLVAVKSAAKEEDMPEAKSKQNEVFGAANGDGLDHEQLVDEVNEAPAKKDDQDKTSEPTEAPAETPNSEPDSEQSGEETEEEKSNKEEKEKKVKGSIAEDNVVEKGALPTQVLRADNYLKTKSALVDFKNIVLKNHRGSNENIMREWGEHLKSKGITGDAVLPTEIESIFFKAWIDNPGILSTFRHVNSRAGSVYAATTEDTALGHKKGEKKKRQSLTATRRDIKVKAIYKMLDIDLQDIFDDATGELLSLRVEELADRVANAVAVGALLTAGAGNDATLEGTRGLYPVVADAGAGGFGGNVVKKVDAAGKTPYEVAIEAVESTYDRDRKGKILIVPEGFRRQIRLMKDKNDSPLFTNVKLEDLFEVKAIYEMPELNSFDGGKVKAIAYVDQAYVTFGQSAGSVRTDFDLDYNQDVMLTERFVGGSAQGYKTFAVAMSE